MIHSLWYTLYNTFPEGHGATVKQTWDARRHNPRNRRRINLVTEFIEIVTQASDEERDEGKGYQRTQMGWTKQHYTGEGPNYLSLSVWKIFITRLPVTRWVKLSLNFDLLVKRVMNFLQLESFRKLNKKKWMKEN